MASFEYECKPVRALLGTTRVAMLSAFEVDAASSATARVPIKAPTLGIVRLRIRRTTGRTSTHLDDVAPVVHGCIRTRGALGQSATTGSSGREQHGQHGKTSGNVH
jgi:hypothetical protein